MKNLMVVGFLVFFACHKPSPNKLSVPLARYYENEISEAIQLLNQNIEKNGKDAETLTWLGQAYLRLGMKDSAKAYAEEALLIDSCSSFTHIVLGNAILPDFKDSVKSHSDLAWYHYHKAIECDSGDPNVWLEIWGESIRRGESDQYHRSLKNLVETGFLTPAAQAYGRWMLNTLPENALLITNGDMDTFPAQALQETEKLRTDILIIERGLLDLTWSIKFLRDHLNMPLTFSNSEIDALSETTDTEGRPIMVSDQIFDQWVREISENVFTRPLTIAPTVDPAFYDRYNKYISNAGSYLQLNSKVVEDYYDMTKIKTSLQGISMKDFSGPWVSNRDLSPIRTIYTKRMVKNITSTSISYSEELIKMQNYEDALSWLNWTETFERNTELGPAFGERISELKKLISMQGVN